MSPPSSRTSSTSSIDQDLRFQRKQWRAERIGWVAMAVLIVCALAGFFGGGGPLAGASSIAGDGSARLSHDRFARFLTPTTVEITVAHPPSARPLHLRVSESYLSSMLVRSITPQPDTVAFADRAYLFAFERLPGATEAKIRLHLEPQAIGSLEGWAVVDNGAPLPIKHFIFP